MREEEERLLRSHRRQHIPIFLKDRDEVHNVNASLERCGMSREEIRQETTTLPQEVADAGGLTIQR